MLKFLLDEQLRGLLWRAIQNHNAAGSLLLDVVRVGDPPDLPLGSDDPSILQWAEREARILVTRDFSTMPGHLADYLNAGRHSPGVLILSPGASITSLVSYLEIAAHAGYPDDFSDRYHRYLFIP